MSALQRLLLTVCCFVLCCLSAAAQKTETFEGITYTIPKGWQKEANPSAVQMGGESPKGTCLLTLFKPLPASTDANVNFKAAWDTIVKEVVTGASGPKMQPPSVESGWTTVSGYAPYTSDGKKGVVLLVTITGQSKMVNLLVLYDSDTFQSEITAFLRSLRLPKIAPETTPTTVLPDKPVSSSTASVAPRKSSFKFTTTNFDDGWTAVEQENWVRATKGGISVLIHYPNPKTSDSSITTQTVWNLLAAPRYTDVRNLTFHDTRGFEAVLYAQAEAEDRTTGKTVHVLLLRKRFNNGSGRYLEFISPNKAALETAFGPLSSEEFGWEKFTNVQNLNRFAVSDTDLVGKWGSSNSAMLQYYYADTGRSAGATATSISEQFVFSTGGTYESDFAGASGVVGNQKFSRIVYKGKYSSDRWKLTLTNRFRGETETYKCHFEAVQGGRLLILVDANNTVKSLVKQ